MNEAAVEATRSSNAAASAACFRSEPACSRPARRCARSTASISRLKRGEVLAIVGESGCGKTTLSRMMLGLLLPTSGEIFFGGKPIHAIDRNEIARRVQPVFQDPYSSLNPRKTLAPIIALPLDVHGIGTREERRARVEELMELVGLPRRLIYAYPSQLSGGQRQRVAIARALAMKSRDRDLRRADLGARRLGAGADPQPAAGFAARAQPHLRHRQP